MEPQLIRFWHQFEGRLQYGAHRDWASFQQWQLGTLLARQQCDSLVQQVTDSGSKSYWCLAGNWVYPCRRGHPRLLVFPFLVVMNHGVWTSPPLHRLHPHKGFPGWEREVNGWRGLYRHETMTGNMAGISLPRTGGPGLHVWLEGMLVTSFLLQKKHCIFFPCWFLWLCRTTPVSFLHSFLQAFYACITQPQKLWCVENLGKISTNLGTEVSKLLTILI